MVSTRSSNIKVPAIELAENGKSIKKVVKIKRGRGRPSKPKSLKTAAKELKLVIEKAMAKPIPTTTTPTTTTTMPTTITTTTPNSKTSSNKKATESDPTVKIVKVEKRGRKRKIPVPDPNAPPPKAEIKATESKPTKASVEEVVELEPIQPKYNDILPLNRKDPRGRKRKQVINVVDNSSSPKANTSTTVAAASPLTPVDSTIISVLTPSPPPSLSGSPVTSPSTVTSVSSKSTSTPTTKASAAALKKTKVKPSNVTSIISQRIDENEFPLSEELSESVPRIRKKYNIDRDNIKINKRIMSKDTNQVIKMFKKFDNEVLTNPEAKQLLLSLGFETRKRYITTFKHYMRFCCSKGLDNFFVTGDLMKQFYEEQFSKSSSDNPIIRLRKMDPAFSKLQEINYLVYKLPFKEIPNRQVAFNYLLYTESGYAGVGNGKIDDMLSVTPESKSETLNDGQDSKLGDKGIMPLAAQAPQGPRVIAYPHRVLEEEGNVIHKSENIEPSLQHHHQKGHHLPHISTLTPQSSNQGQTPILPPVNIPVPLQSHTSIPPISRHQSHDGSSQSTNGKSRRRAPFRKEIIQKIKSEFISTHAELLKNVSDAAQNINQIPQLNMQDIANSYGFLYQQVNRSMDHFSGFLDHCFKLSSTNNGFAQFPAPKMVQTLQLPPPQPQLQQHHHQQQPQQLLPQQQQSQAPFQTQAYHQQQQQQQQQPIHSPILDMNHDIYTVYEIVEEWYVVAPAIEYRLRNWGEYWIKDEMDREAYLDRRSIVEFVDRLAAELKEDRFRVANLCDRYIQDKSILEEFITEIDLDQDDLFKRVLRYRKRKG